MSHPSLQLSALNLPRRSPSSEPTYISIPLSLGERQQHTLPGIATPSLFVLFATHAPPQLVNVG